MSQNIDWTFERSLKKRFFRSSLIPTSSLRISGDNRCQVQYYIPMNVCKCSMYLPTKRWLEVKTKKYKHILFFYMVPGSIFPDCIM